MARTYGALAAVVFLAPLAARAGDITYVEPDNLHIGTQQSVSVMADVGVNRYDRSLAASTEPGVAYGAHLELAANRNVVLDVGYLGALNDLNSRFSRDGRLVTNQIEANLRLNFVPPNWDLPGHFRPFIYTGAGYKHIATQNFTPGMTDADILSVPVGVGAEADVFNRIVVGARFSYAFLFDEEHHFPGGDAHNWVASVNVGARIWP